MRFLFMTRMIDCDPTSAHLSFGLIFFCSLYSLYYPNVPIKFHASLVLQSLGKHYRMCYVSQFCLSFFRFQLYISTSILLMHKLAAVQLQLAAAGKHSACLRFYRFPVLILLSAGLETPLIISDWLSNWLLLVINLSELWTCLPATENSL